MRLLVKVPVPVPLVVWLPLTVGLCDVLQQTPLAVTGEQASAVIVPPQVAVVEVMFVTLAVVTVASEAVVMVTVTVAVPVQPRLLVPVTV